MPTLSQLKTGNSKSVDRKSFSMSYAKDIILALIESDKITKDEIVTTLEEYYNTIERLY